MRVVALEGVNGAGKSSVAESIRNAYVAAGRACITLDPAGRGRVGRVLRPRFVDAGTSVAPDLDSVFFAALRAEGALSLLEDGSLTTDCTVVLERWSLALAAYGAADQADPSLVRELRAMLDRTLAADITVLLDCPGATAFQRSAVSGTRNRFEARGARYLDAVAAAYRRNALTGDVVVVDASQDEHSTFASVRAALATKWPELTFLG